MVEVDKIYEKDGIVVRTSTREDIMYLKDRLRESDVQEIWASHNHKPEKALKICLYQSLVCFTIQNGNPIGMFGISPVDMVGTKASIWFLASNDLDKIKKRFLKNSRKMIDLLLEYYPFLFNWVDCRNEESIKWLEFCGATIEEPKPFGVEGLPFRYFYFDRRT